MNIYIMKIKNFILLLMIMCIVLSSISMSVMSYAAISGDVNTIVSQTYAFEEPSMDSEKIRELNIGDSVFVTGQEGDFYIIYYKEMTQYVPKYAIDGTDAPASVTGVSVNPDAASLASSARKAREESDKALHEEFKQQEAYNEILEDTLEQERKTKRNTVIWITVMVFLCVCMIAVSVLTAIGNKNDQEDIAQNGENKAGNSIEGKTENNKLEDSKSKENIL